MAEAALARHDLVDPDPAAWTALLAGRPDLAGLPHLSGWAAAGRPLVVRRRHPGEAPDAVPLGLPLPPADGKRRIGLSLPRGSVSRRTPPSLDALRTAAPDFWRPTLDALDALARSHGIACRAFGSLLWQGLTGLPYLSAASDLDLLWFAGSVPRAFLDGIARIEATAAMRIDGELVLPDGAGINWRELHGAAPCAEVLAKHLDRLEMRAAAPLFHGAAA
ncbi:malonate decarboxylase holo-[acyl-carrier-protein] synthase [Methylobacterium sp. sgz302541]|uniref:malonate decarboxylase holo-[acyl-carrier-protein] synthase n=1 Tax=unclassified Methylobacterium TaxID=2615210 RepID=UPI003D34D092